MKKINVEWDIIYRDKKVLPKEEIVDVLLKNRGLKTKKQKTDFFEPERPKEISLVKVGLDKKSVTKSIKRIKKALDEKEQIIIYGDYDADGICATAILWETLYNFNKKVLPYIPDRFTEGYGINAESIEKIKAEYSDLKLIITVDNGIVAFDAVKKANELGIDVIITDHHTKSKKLPNAYSIVHTTKTSGSGVSWFLAREITKKIRKSINLIENKLELAAIGTVADQLPLIGVNRSIVKFGLKALGKTKRPGIKALFKEAGILKSSYLPKNDELNISTYEINYIIAPRINAMGRMEHAIDSLRLLCTKSKNQAEKLARHLGSTNKERQRVVEEVVMHAEKKVQNVNFSSVIVLADEKYHEGVIGLAAGKLTDKYSLPSIVISKGNILSKASARSIPGFNIIEAILETESLIEGGGGHPMAAGFSIKTKKISEFQKKFEKIAQSKLNGDTLAKKIKIDCQINFELIDKKFFQKLKEFEPSGMGNRVPLFVSRNVRALQAKTVGYDNKHLKLTLENGGKMFEAIGFNLGDKLKDIQRSDSIDLCYSIDENEWNGNKNLQLKIRDIRLTN